MRPATFLHILLPLFAACPACAATVCYAPLDSLDQWSLRTLGDAAAEVVADPVPQRCVQLTSAGGTVLLSRDLPLDATAGRRVHVSCLLQTTDVVRGPQAASTACLHLAVQTPSGIRHASARFTGTREWSREGFTADVPADARRVVLNLGLEACTGRMRLADLIVRNDGGGVHPLPLASAANATHGQLNLAAFPDGPLAWQDIPFSLLDAARNESGDCLRLAGEGHLDWPTAATVPVPALAGVSEIYLLHGTLGGADRCDTPCAIWTARFVGGHEATLSIFQGREIGRVGRIDDLENWKVAWTGRDAAGTPITFGVTRWKLYSDVPLVSLSCRAYRGTPPVVLALTAVESPPRRLEPAPVVDDETEPGE